MSEVDRARKHRLEQLSKMVPTLMSVPCHRSRHELCDGIYLILTNTADLDAIEAVCGCQCHKEAA